MIPKTLRSLVKRLPILREPEVQKAFANAGLASRTCARCTHFDHAAGQKQFVMSNSALAEAAKHLSPAQMLASELGAAEKGELNPTDQMKPLVTADNPLAGLSWRDAGICTFRPGTVTFRQNTCEDWS